MTFKTLATAAVMVAGSMTLAQAAPSGDAEAGAKVFAKCQTCHVIADADGNVLGGRNSKTGPNLYGLPGRAAGSREDFNYGDSIVSVGTAGYVWDEDGFVAYLANPVNFLKDKTGDSKAKSKMSFRLANEKEARNVYAYIASLSPAAEPAGDEAAATEEEKPVTY